MKHPEKELITDNAEPEENSSMRGCMSRKAIGVHARND